MNRLETHLKNLPQGEKLELAQRLLREVDAPALHIEKMSVGNETCRSADELERQWKESGGA